MSTTDPGVTRCAYDAIDKALAAATFTIPQVNKDEIAGCGPIWACADFGTVNHDYQTCSECKSRYNLWRNHGGGR